MKSTLKLIVHYGRYRTWAPMLNYSVWVFCTLLLICCTHFRAFNLTLEQVGWYSLVPASLPWLYMVADIASTALAQAGVWLILKRKSKAKKEKKKRTPRGEIRREIWNPETQQLEPYEHKS